MKNLPEYVRYIGDGEAGLKYGDVVKVLCADKFGSDRLYVETPKDGIYCGDAAQNPASLKGKKFTYVNSMDYELIKEEKKAEKCNRFKVGDIVCGNDGDRYGITNSSMTKGVVIELRSDGFFDLKVLEHTNKDRIGSIFNWLDSKYFELVIHSTETATPESLYLITTDMETFVNIEHNSSKGWSKCDLRYDDFDIHVGIDIAMDRLKAVENPPVEKELPKYVRYIDNMVSLGGLVNGDICRVLSGVIKGRVLYDDTLFVVCPNPTPYNDKSASNPSALKDHNFDYLHPSEYEIINIHE